MTTVDTALTQKIETLAKRCIRNDLRADEVIRDGVDPLVLEILAALEKKLDGTLRAEHRPFADQFIIPYPQPVTDHHLAKSWLCTELCRSLSRITAERYIRNEFEDSLLLEMFPELRKEMDDQGLFPAGLFKSSRQFGQAIVYKNHAIRLTEAMPYDLETRLVGITTAGTNQTLKIRLSHYAIVRASDFHDPMFKAIVRGPSFAEKFVTQKLYTPNQTSVLERIPLDEEERRCWAMLDPIERFEVNRSEKGSYVSLMAEQVSPLNPKFGKPDNYVKNMLFHSDLEVGGARVVFKHADASLLIYETSQYSNRLNAKFPKTPKAAGHFKMFWLGDCSLSVWKDLFHLTFPGNELVAEFFTGQRCSPWRKEPIA